jgi:hypothetical protein
MRRYMYTMGALYVAYGVASILSMLPDGLPTSGIPTLAGGIGLVFRSNFITIGLLVLFSAWTRFNPRFPRLNEWNGHQIQSRLITLSLMFGFTIGWIVTLIIAGLFYGGALGGIPLWIFILAQQVEPIRYHNITPSAERHMLAILRPLLEEKKGEAAVWSQRY